MANSSSGESVINRAMRLLSAFSTGSETKGLRELSREVGLPTATVYRLMSELEAEGVVVKDEHGRWRHGNRLWEIASRGAHAADLRQAALLAMEDLMHSTGAHVSLGVLDGNDVLYIERLAPDESTVNITSVAGRLPAHACSAGLTLIAFGPQQKQEVLLRRRLEKHTDKTVTDPEQLRALLAKIRQDGYACLEGFIVPVSSGISVPVFNADGEVLATLTVIVPIGSENLSTTVPQLLFASRVVMRRLGVAPTMAHQRRSLKGPS